MAVDFVRAVIASGRASAATAREDRAYAAAVSAFQDRDVEPRRSGVRPVHPKIPEIRPLGRGGVAAGRGGIQAEQTAGSRRTARPCTKPEPGISPTNMFTGLARRSFNTGIFPAAAETFDSLTRDFPNHRCGCGRWWRRRRPRAGRMNGRRWVRRWSRPTACSSARCRWIPPVNWSRGAACCWRQANARKGIFPERPLVLESLDPQNAPAADCTGSASTCSIRPNWPPATPNAALAATDRSGAGSPWPEKRRRFAGQRPDVARAGAGATGAKIRGHRRLYQEMLRLNTPVERVRQAILKMAEWPSPKTSFPTPNRRWRNFSRNSAGFGGRRMWRC